MNENFKHSCCEMGMKSLVYLRWENDDQYIYNSSEIEKVCTVTSNISDEHSTPDTYVVEESL